MVSSQYVSYAEDLLNKAGIQFSNLVLNTVTGGGNNKVFSVDADDQRFLLKSYYVNPQDKRDRLGAEYSFLGYVASAGIDSVPRPVARNVDNSTGLYEFVEGSKIHPESLARRHVMEAADFIYAINNVADRDTGLPVASEGCFSIDQHIRLVEGRIERLRKMPVETDIEKQAQNFVDDLLQIWAGIKNGLASEYDTLTEQLAPEDRCISPSDFGFHNALVKNDGSICFIDFEYAGWDDPAKLVGDFFSQPAVPVSDEYFNEFAGKALAYSSNVNELVRRAHNLLPVFQVKWCCIMMNEFLPDAAKRRSFARPDVDPEINKRIQLDKAQNFFNLRLV